MSWQKCPACDGAGMVGLGFPYGNACDVCGGQKIINEQTGEPPKRIVTTTTTVIDPSFNWDSVTVTSTKESAGE